MVAVGASRAGLTGVGFGRTGSCWRRHNMNTIASSPSRMMMIESLPTIQYLLEKCPSSLSVCEKGMLADFATLVAENMENDPEDPIIILLYSITHPAFMEEREKGIGAVLCAINSLALGVSVRLCRERSRVRARLMSQGMYQKNGRYNRSATIVRLPSRECRSDQE